jgi:hypothetical protein
VSRGFGGRIAPGRPLRNRREGNRVSFPRLANRLE